MRREIYEQPTAIAKTVAKHLKDDIIFPGELDAIESALLTFEKLIIAASGSSRHAGLAGEIMIEDLSGVAVDVEYASEYCYRSTHAAVDPIVMVITQSGETADTIAAQREALTRGVKTIAISNVDATTIVREAGAALISGAGPEVSIPATKSFTTQLTILYLMALFLARKRGRMTSEVTRSYLQRLNRLPEAIERNLRIWDALAEEFGAVHFKAEKFLYLGRGVHYAIAREGALKLKEISYAHAEGYPAGELKHGPKAIVDEKLPVVVLGHLRPRRSGLRPALSPHAGSDEGSEVSPRPAGGRCNRGQRGSLSHRESRLLRARSARTPAAHCRSDPATALRLSRSREQRIRCGPSQKSGESRSHRVRKIGTCLIIGL